MTSTAPQSVAHVLSSSADQLLALEGVTGAGEGLCSTAAGNDTPCIKVYCRSADDRLADDVRAILAAVPFELVESGPVSAQE